MEKLKEYYSFVFITALTVVGAVTDGNAERYGWMVLDLLLWPLGAVRGIIACFGGL
ncbi:hypothetical protein [Kosakonia phage Kc166A]|uniref:Uncharacterized protein n=1 Tax=Kosakonia phage Kc166A TaxID=2801381 RepID=A0AAE7RFW0_9CAUD|nr:hypothetical protein [Kosakonia phage Kc166A]